MLEVTSAFNVTLHVPQLKSDETKRVLLQTESFSPSEVTPAGRRAMATHLTRWSSPPCCSHHLHVYSCTICAQVDGAVSMLEPDMPIKRLLMLLEMAQHSGKSQDVLSSNGRITLTRWVECIQDLHG